MQDIDFDELDRAVSSALGHPSPNDDRSSSPVPTAEPRISGTSTPIQRPSSSTSPAARRSSGRFMDVVHPSSDMRSTATPTVRPTASSPSNPASEPELKVETSDASGAIETLDTTAPLETPFISDAKVEKRPLGAFSQTGESSPKVDLAAALADENDESNSSVANFGFTEMSTSEKSLEPSVGNQEVSDLEISEEALIGSTETADTTPSSETPVADEVASVESKDQQPIAETAVTPVEITTPAESTVAEAQSEDVEKSTPPLMPIANASIPQQYREKSEDHQASGTIYDTENYHQPISPTPKKTHKKIVSLILWLVGLVVLGVGLGTLFYYVILPALS